MEGNLLYQIYEKEILLISSSHEALEFYFNSVRECAQAKFSSHVNSMTSVKTASAVSGNIQIRRGKTKTNIHWLKKTFLKMSSCKKSSLLVPPAAVPMKFLDTFFFLVIKPLDATW